LIWRMSSDGKEIYHKYGYMVIYIFGVLYIYNVTHIYCKAYILM
jgi:hypothetical protein